MVRALAVIALVALCAAAKEPKLEFTAADKSSCLIEKAGTKLQSNCGLVLGDVDVIARIEALEVAVAALQKGNQNQGNDGREEAGFIAGDTVENTFASIRSGCPAGTTVARCTDRSKYDEIRTWTVNQPGSSVYLANCVLQGSNLGYYDGSHYVNPGIGAPGNCPHCRGNGDGCTHEIFGHDPLGFKAGIGTHDWGLCDTCMHHKCESRQYGTAICLAPKGWKKPLEPRIVTGAVAENTYASIRNACPAGSKPLKCNKLEQYNKFRRFAIAQSGSDHYLANCVLQGSTLGYYDGNIFMSGGFGVPGTCTHCKGNGDGCTSHNFGYDPLAMKAGVGTSDWGLCGTCMHHQCEQLRHGTVVCETDGTGPAPTPSPTNSPTKSLGYGGDACKLKCVGSRSHFESYGGGCDTEKHYTGWNMENGGHHQEMMDPCGAKVFGGLQWYYSWCGGYRGNNALVQCSNDGRSWINVANVAIAASSCGVHTAPINSWDPAYKANPVKCNYWKLSHTGDKGSSHGPLIGWVKIIQGK